MNTLGCHRHRAQGHPRINGRLATKLEVIPEEKSIPSRLFGLVRQFAVEENMPGNYGCAPEGMSAVSTSTRSQSVTVVAVTKCNCSQMYKCNCFDQSVFVC